VLFPRILDWHVSCTRTTAKGEAAVPTTGRLSTIAAITALVATFVGAANTAGPGISEVLMALAALTALSLARSPEGGDR
jgi:hypothetical protein